MCAYYYFINLVLNLSVFWCCPAFLRQREKNYYFAINSVFATQLWPFGCLLQSTP